MTALENLEGTALVADDILIFGTGNTYKEAEVNHDKHLTALMERAKEKNLKFNPKKFQFKQKELKYIGHIITDSGIKIDPAKIEAITKMDAPTDKTSLLRFIGMVNYLSPFCNHLSNTIRPLTDLTKNDMIFNKSVTLQVDASESGLGGTLLQPNENGKLQPVAYTSCSLTPTERRYSQIEKECLAICNTFTKFDQWLYGKSQITVHTDHKPLETIFKKPLNKAQARLQKMMMRLQRYQFEVVYKKGTLLYIADTLSRAYNLSETTCEINNFEVFSL